jgi:hypothetical protein
MHKTAIPIIVLVLSPFVSGFAQSEARCVRGIVTDREGAPLGSAVAQIEDTASLRIRSFVTRNDGAYYFMELGPDRDYIIRAHYGNVWGRPKTLSQFNSRKEAIVNLKVETLKEQ